MKTNENKLTGVFEMRNNESSENYLETILILSKKLPVVRSVDIANELGFKKSSVSIAMKTLERRTISQLVMQALSHLQSQEDR